MKRTIWQYSLRGLLVFTSLVAIVSAFVANYPTLAFLITFGAAWILIESGVIIDLGNKLSNPSVRIRHPFLVAGASLFTGSTSLFFCVGCCYMLWRSPNKNWAALIPIVLFAILGGFCFRPLWLLRSNSSTIDETNEGLNILCAASEKEAESISSAPKHKA